MYEGRIGEARHQFQEAVRLYQESASENSSEVLGSLAFTEGMVAAALAGDDGMVHRLAETVQSIVDRNDLTSEDAHADRLYLAAVLSSGILDSIEEDDLSTLRAVNEQKSGVDKVYGQAIIAFGRGVRDGNTDLIEESIRLMLDYHDQRHDSEDVIAQIMAPRATALLIIARQAGYDVAVESEYIPADLVGAAVG
jgi:hypothetical protein